MVEQRLEGFRYHLGLIARTEEEALVARVWELPFQEFECVALFDYVSDHANLK